jgi:hypothetical protein
MVDRCDPAQTPRHAFDVVCSEYVDVPGYSATVAERSCYGVLRMVIYVIWVMSSVGIGACGPLLRGMQYNKSLQLHRAYQFLVLKAVPKISNLRLLCHLAQAAVRC